MQNTESYSCIYSTKMPLFVLASLYTTDIRGPCFKRDFGLTLYIHDWDSERHQPIFVRMLHDLIFEVQLGQNKIQSYPLQSLLVLISWRRLYLGIPCVIDLRCSDGWCLSFPCMAIWCLLVWHLLSLWPPWKHYYSPKIELSSIQIKVLFRADIQ